MTRDEAEKLVRPYVTKIGPYSAISHKDALALLGEESFAALLKDPIRKHGPTKDSISPWNVIDALFQPKILKLDKKEEDEKLRQAEAALAKLTKKERELLGLWTKFADGDKKDG